MTKPKSTTILILVIATLCIFNAALHVKVTMLETQLASHRRWRDNVSRYFEDLDELYDYLSSKIAELERGN